MATDLSTNRTRIFITVLAAGVFTSGLNVSVISPLVTSIGREFDVSDAAVGQLAALHAVIAGVVALLVAPWIDRFPRRSVLRLESSLLLLATIVSALAPTFAWLFVGRALAGVGGAIIAAICFAAIGDLFPDASQRNRAIAIVSAAFSVSAIAGLPLITQLADSFGWRWGMACLLLPTLIVFAGTWLLPAQTARAASEHQPASSGYRAVLSNWQVNWLLVTMIVMCMVLAGWTVFFGAYTTDVFAISANALSLLFLAAGVANLIGCSLAPVLMRMRQTRTVYVLATLAMSASLLLVSLVSGDWWLVLPFAVSIGITNTVLYLTASVLLLESMPENRGAVMTLQTGCFEFGWAMGTSMTGVMLSALGGYAAVHQVLAMFLLLSLASLALSTRQSRVVTVERVDPSRGVAT